MTKGGGTTTHDSDHTSCHIARTAASVAKMIMTTLGKFLTRAKAQPKRGKMTILYGHSTCYGLTVRRLGGPFVLPSQRVVMTPVRLLQLNVTTAPSNVRPSRSSLATMSQYAMMDRDTAHSGNPEWAAAA